MLHPIGQQVYKLELPKKWRLHNVFYLSLLEQNTTRKKRVEKIPELDTGNDSKEYKLKAIRDSAVYANKLESGYLPSFYYLVAWKGYLEEKNNWKLLSAVQHLKKLISSFYKDYLKKPIATSLRINSAVPIVKPKVKSIIK